MTAVGAPIVLPTAGATAFGFDFNPAVDRVRVVTNAGNNFRLNPNNGALAGIDTAINPAGIESSRGAAYTNSFGQPLVGGTTTLYTLDATQQRAGDSDSAEQRHADGVEDGDPQRRAARFHRGQRFRHRA